MDKRQITNDDIEKAKKCMEDIDLLSRNQTLKILKKHFYKKASIVEPGTWEDRPEKIYKKDLREMDIEVIADILTNIAIYLSAFKQDGFETMEK